MEENIVTTVVPSSTEAPTKAPKNINVYTSKLWADMHTTQSPTEPPVEYTIAVVADEYCTVTSSLDKACAGTEIELTVEFDELFVNSVKLTYVNTDDTEAEPVEIVDGKFVMPEYNVTVNAESVLNTVREINENILTSAKDYTYDDRSYIGNINIDKLASTLQVNYNITVADSTLEDGKAIMNDLARFAGAVYRTQADKSDAIKHMVSVIEFDSVLYTWDETGTLKGSNYISDNGTSLVTAIVTAIKEDLDPEQGKYHADFYTTMPNIGETVETVKYCLHIN